MRVDLLLEKLLTATAAKTAASRRVDRYRDQLDTEARRRFADEGAAPSWKAPDLGTVRLDPKPAKAYVEDRDAFASYVAQRWPSECTATLTVSDPTRLAAALQALEFAGVPVTAAVDVRPQFAETLLGNARVTYDEDPTLRSAVRIINADTGEAELIDGAGVLPASASLVVTLDKTAKARTLTAVDEELDVELEHEAPPPTAEQQAHAAAVADRLRELAAAGGRETSPDPLVDREPYVGIGADGARRSAQVDVEEAGTLEEGNPRRLELLDSARRWEEQADRLEHAGAHVAERVVEAGLRTVDREAEQSRASILGQPDPYPAPAPASHTDPALIGPAEPEPVPPTSEPGLIDELVKLTSDDLKRAARAKRLPIGGTKVLLAHRLVRAGVDSVDSVLAHRPSP